MKFQPLPIGVDNFENIIKNGYYYVDKTLMIKELLDKKGEVTLFTRPRRFGKTLNMSMLQDFFEDTGNREKNIKRKMLFENLKIMKAGKAYIERMCQYSVISLSLKSAKQSDFETAYYCITEEIAREFKRHREILGQITLEEDKRRYLNIMNQKASRAELATALRFLSDCLYLTNEKKIIILLDEYDVPLENAYYNNFYNEMIGVIRSLFESALKTNPYLEFAVITGCLRISKESIFTGLNNLEVISIVDELFGEYFGFTQEELNQILQNYELSSKKELMQKWYDGYRLGGQDVYNPWSVINYVKALVENINALPRPYWSNTSSNSIVRDLIKRADMSAKAEIEALLRGETIEKPIYEEITYDSIYDSTDNLWNFLFYTGYLKQTSQRLEGRNLLVSLAIPNEEVAYIYENTITSWFKEELQLLNLTPIYDTLLRGNASGFQEGLQGLLQKTISYMDNKEAFYHGFLLGVLGNLKEYLVQSNRESGNGRFDILVRSLNVSRPPVIIELKLSKTFKGMETACDFALEQIQKMKYDEWLPEEGYVGAWHYGIAFFKKQCYVKALYKEFE